jgi:Na+/proline symporter
MNITLIIYIGGLLDSLRTVLVVIALLPVAVLVAIWFGSTGEFFEDCENWNEGAKKWVKRGIWTTALSTSLACLLPSSNTFAAMVIVPRIIESEMIQKDMPEVYKAAKDQLLESLTPDSK